MTPTYDNIMTPTTYDTNLMTTFSQLRTCAIHCKPIHFAFDKLNNPTDADNNVSTFISNLIIDNSRILHTIYSRTSNFLLLLEALYIKSHSPSLNTGLKASKELKLFS